MSNEHIVTYTDTFGGEPNYSWVRRTVISMPDLTHYGYTGSADGSYGPANRAYMRELMRRAKAANGLTGTRGRTETVGGDRYFRPYGSRTILMVEDC